MGILIVVLGLVLWALAHFFKRIAPARRAAMGQAGRGIVAAGVVGGLVLMIVGYRMADFVPVWTPPAWTVHINNVMMLGAVFLFGMSQTTGRLRGKMRHPQLAAVKVWAVAHLLVNGDLASIVLFGGLLIWAVAEVVVINRSEPWDRPEPGDPARDPLLLMITLAMFIVISGIHAWLGVWPFPG